MPDKRLNLPDRRLLFFTDVEEEIQRRASRKDPKFVLVGPQNEPWKKFVREEDGLKIFAVNGEKLRNNLSVLFGHGGHGLVHEFIPLGEIWIDIRHYACICLIGCDCDNLRRKNQPVSKAFFESTIIHEKTEFFEMTKGRLFFEAHQIAEQAEIKAGLLPLDGTTELDWPYPVLKSVRGKMKWVA